LLTALEGRPGNSAFVVELERSLQPGVRVAAPSLPGTSQGRRHFPDLVTVPLEPGRDGDKRSLFARQFQAMKVGLGREERREGRRVDTELLGRGSVLLAGEGESSSVHEESVARLGALSEQEILPWTPRWWTGSGQRRRRKLLLSRLLWICPSCKAI
jgi:hypothetical protein